MSPTRHSSRATLLAAIAAIAASALIGVIATTASVAATGHSAKPVGHSVRRVRIIVDGVRYAPKAFHRFDGQPLYSYATNSPRQLIAFTNLGRYKAFLRTKGLRLPASSKARPASAHASSENEYAHLCTDWLGYGWCYNLGSGLGVANFAALARCCGFFANNIEWVVTYGRASTFLFGAPNFDPASGTIVLSGNGTWDLNMFGWANRANSVYMAW